MQATSDVVMSSRICTASMCCCLRRGGQLRQITSHANSAPLALGVAHAVQEHGWRRKVDVACARLGWHKRTAAARVCLTAALRQNVLPRQGHPTRLGLQQVALAGEGDLSMQPRAPAFCVSAFTAGGVEH
jgi:hypothetical protein